MKEGFELHAGESGVGSFLGEIPLLTGAPRSASTRAKRPSEVRESAEAELHGIYRNRPEIATQISRVVAERSIRNSALSEGLSATEVQAEGAISSARLLGSIRKFCGS